MADSISTLTSPLAFLAPPAFYAPAGSAIGSDLSRTLFLSNDEDGRTAVWGNPGSFGAQFNFSGGTVSAHASRYVQASSKATKATKATEAPLAINEQIDFIRKELGMNMSELATSLQVTRPTVYSWAKGVEPQPVAVTRLTKLLLVAKDVEKLKLSRIDTLIRRPLADAPFSGRSLLDLIVSNEDVTPTHLSIFTAIDKRETETRSQAKGTRQLRSTEVVLAELGSANIQG